MGSRCRFVFVGVDSMLSDIVFLYLGQGFDTTWALLSMEQGLVMGT